MLQILDDSDIKATFFFETWSVTVYPDVVKNVVGRGHELGWHGFQHEMWSTLSPKEEEEVFKKSFAEANKLGIKYDGFRPPGGLINENTTFDLLHEYGIRYISPVAEKAAIVHNIPVLPFHWKTIDAYFYMQEMSGIRQLYGSEAQKGVLTPTTLKGQFLEQVEEAVKHLRRNSLL
jgi:peptidoglycan/xylan/chitin deacetylase (PgdA/CDA1 family)